jgi:hypothetical protein
MAASAHCSRLHLLQPVMSGSAQVNAMRRFSR